jgi:hypothetical protein
MAGPNVHRYILRQCIEHFIVKPFIVCREEDFWTLAKLNRCLYLLKLYLPTCVRQNLLQSKWDKISQLWIYSGFPWWGVQLGGMSRYFVRDGRANATKRNREWFRSEVGFFGMSKYIHVGRWNEAANWTIVCVRAARFLLVQQTENIPKCPQNIPKRP